MKPIKVILIAGEISGDLLGAKLMKELKKQYEGEVVFSGVGGKKMIAQGMQSLFDMSELSIMGFSEIIPHIPNLLNRISQVANFINESSASIVISIDSPAFSFRVMKKVHNQKIKKLHYVAPTVWAYDEMRAEKISKIYNGLAVILPFEPPFFEKWGLPTKFVGHPIIEEVPEISKSKKNAIKSEFREKYQIKPNTKIITLMPGSRKNEVSRLLPILAEAANEIATQKKIILIIPTLPHLHEFIANKIHLFNVNVIFCQNHDRVQAFHAADFGLIKSGTSALEVALAGLPHIITYKVNWLSAKIIKIKLKTHFVNLVNILLGRLIVPELLQEKCRPDEIAKSLLEIMNSEEKQEYQKKAFAEVAQKLGAKEQLTPSAQMAKFVLEMIKPSKS